MDKYKETFETWNKVASLYRDKFMDLDLYNETYDFICDSIQKEKAKLFEIGCGPGNITKYLLSRRPDFDLFAIDVAPNMVEIARQNSPAASFAVMDCRQIEKIDAKFDGIICGFCIPYLAPPDAKKLIFDCANKLDRNGLLYISFEEGDSGNSGYRIGSNGDRIYFYYHSINEIQDYLVAGKFDIIKIFEIVYERSESHKEIHKIVIAKKKD